MQETWVQSLGGEQCREKQLTSLVDLGSQLPWLCPSRVLCSHLQATGVFG